MILNTQTIPYVHAWCMFLFMLMKSLAPVSGYVLDLKRAHAWNLALWITFFHCPLKQPKLGFSWCYFCSSAFYTQRSFTRPPATCHCYGSACWWQEWELSELDGPFSICFLPPNLYLRQVRSHGINSTIGLLMMHRQKTLKPECDFKVPNVRYLEQVQEIQENTITFTGERDL